MKRNSETHPLYINSIPAGAGKIGMTICPGKKGESIYGATWDRSLEIDFAALATWGADAVLTLVEEHEFELLEVPAFADIAQAQPFVWHHLPFVDGGIPGEHFEQQWQRVGPQIRKVLTRGGKVLIHCRGGLGRTGLVAARLLIEFGAEPEQAIATVRTARPGAIETQAQEDYLYLLVMHTADEEGGANV